MRTGPLCDPRRYILWTVLFMRLVPFVSSLTLTQGIKESANFRFLQGLSVIFGFRRDCPRFLASCRDCCAWKIASYRDCPCDLASCRAGSRITRTVSAGIHFSWTVVTTGSKRSRTISADTKYDGEFLQEAKICGLVYTPWLRNYKEELFLSLGIYMYLHSNVQSVVCY